MSNLQNELEIKRWKECSKNPEFEEPSDPMHPHSRRYQIELDRYLNTMNLSFQPPMPKPFLKTEPKETGRQK